MWLPAPEPIVDPVRAATDPRGLRMPKALDRFAEPPLFICGSARSGTTWTFDLFDRHPAVWAICESWLLSQTQGLMGVFAQQTWDPAANDLWMQKVSVPTGTVQLLSYTEMVRDLSELVAGWMVRRATDDHRFLVAKEFLDVGAASILFPQARFVHVIRDGRNVALSMRRASETWNPAMGVDLPMTFRAEAWRRQVESIRAHRDHLGDRYLEVRYEDMLTDTVGVMRTLFEFCRIPYDDDLLGRIRAQTDLSSYGDAALQSGFRGASRDSDWSDVFTLRDAIGFHRAAGGLLIELGYEADGGWLARQSVKAAAVRWPKRKSAADRRAVTG